MYKIVTKKQFSEKVFLFEIEAPLIAKSRKPGNFVIVRVDKHSERMPLTIADSDVERGTITLVIQEVGLSSTRMWATKSLTLLVLWATLRTLRSSVPLSVPAVALVQHLCCLSCAD